MVGISAELIKIWWEALEKREKRELIWEIISRKNWQDLVNDWIEGGVTDHTQVSSWDGWENGGTIWRSRALEERCWVWFLNTVSFKYLSREEMKIWNLTAYKVNEINLGSYQHLKGRGTEKQARNNKEWSESIMRRVRVWTQRFKDRVSRRKE